MDIQINPSVHPANVGLDFSFDGGISEEVLKNYLSRCIVDSLFDYSAKNRMLFNDSARMLFNIGAKYVSRSVADSVWFASKHEEEEHPIIQKDIEELHKLDPEIIFEACIFETATDLLNEIAIPAWVFEAFDLPVEKRNFKYEDMRFPDGKWHTMYGPTRCVPDIRQTETQMYIYYRACNFIDMGFEGLHMGQTNMTGFGDPENICYTKIFRMIHDYAKTHARRHWVLMNAMRGDFNMMGTDGKLLEDFSTWPIFMTQHPDDTAHEPSEDNPQRCYMHVGDPRTLYWRGQGGITPSGWHCEHLPYKAELDNYGGLPGKEHQPHITHWPWGYDEISWFASQPDSYRREWLEYAYITIHTLDPNAYFEMPGLRNCDIYKLKRHDFYYANSSKNWPNGFNDEETIRRVWIESRKKFETMNYSEENK